MADEETPTDGIEGIGFGLTVNDAASPVLKKFEATVNSATKAMVAEFSKMSAASEASTKRLDTANKEHADILEDESGNVIRSLNDMGSQYDQLADTVEGTVANIEKAFSKSKGGAKDVQKAIQSMAGLSGLGFDALGKRVKALDQALGLTFKNTTKQNEDFTKKFLQKNEQTIRRAIEEWKSFGQAVPAQLEKAEKALDSFPKKGTFMKIEDLFAKVKGLSVSNTLIGAAAVGGLHSQYEGAENVYGIAAEGSKTQKMDEGQFQKRRQDVADAGIETGGNWQDIRAINEQYSKLAYLGPSSFVATTKAAMELHRVTGMSVDSSAKLAVQLRQQYNQTDSQVSETTKSIAALSKMSGASADELSGVYDELKFMKFSLDGNAEAAGRLTKATVNAAAGMAKYGLDAKVAIHDVKSVMEGGVDEYQQNLTTMILGGASPEEAMQLLDDIAEGGDKAVASFDKMEKYRNRSVTKQRDMYKGLRAGVARAGSNDQIRETTGMTVEEADKRSAKDRGLLPKGELEKAQSSQEAMKKAEAEANTRRATASELATEAVTRGWAVSAKAATGMYDAAHKAAEFFNDGSKGLGGAALALGGSALSLIGSAVSLGLAGLSLMSGVNSLRGLGILGQGGKSGGLLNFAKGLFGKAGPSLAGAAEGGAALAPAASSVVPGAVGATGAGAGVAAGAGSGVAATAFTAVGAASTGAIVATVLAGLAVGGIVGTIIDWATNKIPLLKKLKEGVSDFIVGMFGGGQKSVTTAEAFGGTKYEGKTPEELQKLKAEKWAGKNAGIPQNTTTTVPSIGQTDAQRATAKFEAEQAAKAAQAGTLGVQDTAKAVTSVNKSLADSAKTTSATAETIEEKAKRAAKDHETMAKAFNTYFDKQVATTEKAKKGVPGSTAATSTPPMTVSSHGETPTLVPAPTEKPKINLAPYMNKGTTVPQGAVSVPEAMPIPVATPEAATPASAQKQSKKKKKGYDIEQYRPLVEQAAKKWGIPVEGLMAQIKQESGGNPNAQSVVGAKGLMQFMPETAKQYGIAGQETNPAASIEAGAHYMADLKKQFNGDLVKASMAYNVGQGNLNKILKGQRWGGKTGNKNLGMPSETAHYGDVVGGAYARNKSTVPETSLASLKLDTGKQTATPLPTTDAGSSVVASHAVKTDTTKSAIETASLASKQEPFIGTTEGDQNVISELRKTNSLLARMVSQGNSNKGNNRIPSFMIDELNQGGMG